MYTATILITIDQFVPMNGVVAQSPSIVAQLSPPRDTSASQPPGGSVFAGNGESIVVTLPPTYVGSVLLTYQLPNPAYTLIGIAFRPTPTPKGTDVGRQEFRTVNIQRDPFGSQMTVTDASLRALSGIDFNYVILVQEVASGNIGLIDPDIETDYGSN